MRRLIRALACLGGLAVLSTTPAQAAATPAQATGYDPCRVKAVKPVLKKNSVHAVGVRTGCTDSSRLRVQINWAREGRDPVLDRERKTLRNGKLAAAVRCSKTARTYYTVVTDAEGNVAKSRGARLRCAPPAAPTPRPAPPSGSVGTAIEEEVVRLTNEARKTAGCKPLVHDAKLHVAASGHSADMAETNYFSHTSKDGRNPGDRMKAAGFSPMRAWGENIAMGQPTPAAVVKGWLNSPGHRANIENCSFTHIGSGAVKGARGIYWTQAFARH
ncbi:CAP domain-containing protein [Spongiactinospora sp. TRM90649]|uniref:CAP domain-containing protein n=1 Tax=Spongiactinospora sp. TRM90649 TaxID=3031114 RepID=UPI0023F7F4CE|nr:CAP domain-containing protein [Spongiactinospora sp. TRM90649]MDF5753387.1 CAP domain-containing protein [Spongiactinospora sp. TRM90649]